jgi:hypothetical protein
MYEPKFKSKFLPQEYQTSGFICECPSCGTMLPIKKYGDVRKLAVTELGGYDSIRVIVSEHIPSNFEHTLQLDLFGGYKVIGVEKELHLTDLTQEPIIVKEGKYVWRIFYNDGVIAIVNREKISA